MFIIDYLQHWYWSRPRRLSNSPNPNHGFTLMTLEEEHGKICSTLKLKRHPSVYIEGKTDYYYRQPDGVIIYKRHYSAIFLAYIESDLLFNLAHELYHEYQHENEKSLFRNDEQHEIEADGFALAWVELRGKNTVGNNYKSFYPQKVGHIYFSEKTATTRNKDGIPIAVRVKADEYWTKFHLESKIE